VVRASWAQENILRTHPDADLRVFVGWIPALYGDADPKVADLLVDARAKHYWDGRRAVGRAVARMLHLGPGSFAWDIYLVYGPDAKWGDTPEATGSPVISASGGLQQALEPYLGGS
jgi:hypothetical protein